MDHLYTGGPGFESHARQVLSGRGFGVKTHDKSTCRPCFTVATPKQRDKLKSLFVYGDIIIPPVNWCQCSVLKSKNSRRLQGSVLFRSQTLHIITNPPFPRWSTKVTALAGQPVLKSHSLSNRPNYLDEVWILKSIKTYFGLFSIHFCRKCSYFHLMAFSLF